MQNHFQTLELEPSFSVSEVELQRLYLQAQQQYHPDRQIGKSDIERQKAALNSAAANDAYRVLKDNYLRACHLLELQGLKVSGDNATVKPEQSLLMEVMQWNEDVEDSKGAEAAMLLGKLQAEHEYLIIALAGDIKPQSVIRLGYLEKTISNLTRKVKVMAS